VLLETRGGRNNVIQTGEEVTIIDFLVVVLLKFQIKGLIMKKLLAQKTNSINCNFVIK